MTIRGWKTQFKEIRKEFGYLEKDDLISANKLDSLLKGKNSKNQFQNMIKGRTVFIIGAGPSLTRSLKYIKKSKNVVKIVADGAVRALLEKNIKPDILVTDLDGDLKSIEKIGKTKIPIIAHAHGDNYEKLEIVKKFRNVVGSTQTKKMGKVENFGGFGKYSKHRIINRKIKIKKLKFGKKIVEWIGTKSKADLFSTNRIKGYKTIRMVDLECIENF